MGLLDDLERAPTGTRRPLSAVLDDVPFNEQGLIPAIAQDESTRAVLMLGWMDREALRRSLNDGYATYYSRSRATYWRKGETSGHLQSLVDARLDCDGDTLLLTVRQQGPACHTNRPTCFYLRIDGDEVVVIDEPTHGQADAT